jgi:hypothetical protein
MIGSQTHFWGFYDHTENGQLLLLGEAIRQFKILTLESESNKQDAFAVDGIALV